MFTGKDQVVGCELSSILGGEIERPDFAQTYMYAYANSSYKKSI